MSRLGSTETEVITAAAVSASASGDTTVIAAPTKSTRILFWGCSARASNSAAVLVTLRFDGGSSLYIFTLSAGQYVSRNLGAGQRCIVGTTAFEINLSAAQAVDVSVEYEQF